jgi:GntR family transcriptional regulator
VTTGKKVKQRKHRSAVEAEHSIMRADAVPLYHQIFLALRDDIVSGRTPFGAAMPTEFELAAKYAVSRITARRALLELADKGFVERKRRTGTRVVFRSPTAPIEANLEHALEALVAFGRNTRVRVLHVDERPADAEVADTLRISEGSPVICSERIRYLNREPLGHIVSHVPKQFAAQVTRAALETTPILELLRDSGLKIAGGRQTVSALTAEPSLAAALQLEPRSVILRIERVVTDPDGVPLLRTIAQYRADRYRVSVDLHGAGPDV